MTPARLPHALRALLVFATVSACGGGPSPDAGADSGVNQPPRWVSAPATVALDQGRHRLVEARWEDPDGDRAVHSVTAPAGIAVSVEGEGSAVRLHLVADYTVTGEHRVAVTTTDARGAAATHTITVTVRPLRWLRRTQWTDAGPEAREHSVLLVDAPRNELFLWGGSGYNPYGTPLGDAWRLDVATGAWRAATLDGDPLPAGGSRRAVTLEDGTTYLFGSYGRGGASTNELFRLTLRDGGATVRRVTQAAPPPARSLHAFGYDPTTRRFAVFGGVGTSIREDTLVMTLDGDAATWRRIETPDGPSPRYGMFHGFDAERGRLIVWSGAQGFAPLDPARDAWALDLRADPPAWRQLTTGDEPGTPAGRRNGVAVFDPTGPRLFVFGGTGDGRTSEPGLWALDVYPGAERWHRVEREGEPPVRSSGFGVFDPQRGEVHLGFGNTANAVYRDVAVLGY